MPASGRWYAWAECPTFTISPIKLMTTDTTTPDTEATVPAEETTTPEAETTTEPVLEEETTPNGDEPKGEDEADGEDAEDESAEAE